MRIEEVLSELAFHGRKCTKDCSGHSAGYNYVIQRKKAIPCKSTSPSFNSGCEIANSQIRKNKIVQPKIR